jgi:hypothetical protein
LFVEAEQHTQAAVSLAISFDLHKIRSANPQSPTLLGLEGGREIYPSRPKDGLEEGERINAFWTVFFLERSLTICLGRESYRFGTLDDPLIGIDTPWPIDMDEYSTVSHVSLTQSSTSLKSFVAATSSLARLLDHSEPVRQKRQWLLTPALLSLWDEYQSHGNLPPSLLPVFDLEAWSVISRILAQDTNLHPSRADMTAEDFQNVILKCQSLNQLIVDDIFPFLPAPLDWNNSSTTITPKVSAAQRTLALTHALLSGALLRIHTLFLTCGYEASQPLCVNAAQRILRAVGDMGLPDFHRQSPVIGVLFGLACRTLSNAYDADIVRYGVGSEYATELQDSLTGGITMMSMLSVECPLIGELCFANHLP